MRNNFKRLLLMATVLGLSAPVAIAQVSATPGAAMAEAQARLACGTGTVVSAEYIPGGLLRVQCSQTTQSAADAASGGAGTGAGILAGTGLTAPAAGGIGGAIVVLGIALGGSDDDSTTTTTTTTLSGE